MYNRRNGGTREIVAAQYSAKQVESVLKACGIDVEAETLNDFLCLCPFHGNRRTPSFSVSKLSGSYLCFNGACAEFGGLLELVKATARVKDFEAMRIVGRAKKDSVVSFRDKLQLALAPPVEFEEFPQSIIDRMKEQFWDDSPGLAYMRGRGFEDSILEEYSIGYSPKRGGLVAVPMHTETGQPIGVIGRGVAEKVFKNSDGLHTSKTMFNLHRAKRTGDAVIVCESSFDVLRLAQYGYPNAVACLSGNFSANHLWQLDKYFSTIVIMTDFDDAESHKYLGCRKCSAKGLRNCAGHNPGRALGETISERVTNKAVLWASYDYKIIYPHGAKDVGDMTGPEIRQCIKNAVPNYEYHQWGIAS